MDRVLMPCQHGWEIRMTDQSSRLDYIDGLRSIAITMVVLTHV